jgi:hypothetical protein
VCSSSWWWRQYSLLKHQSYLPDDMGQHPRRLPMSWFAWLCARPQPEFETRLRYSRGSIWTGCFGFGSGSGVSSIQKRSLGHRTILYKLDMCLLRCLCYVRQGSQHAVAMWGLSATTRHRKRGLFLWNLSQRENPWVASGGVREEVCTLYRWGRGYAACSRKVVVVLGLRTKGAKLLCERKK